MNALTVTDLSKSYGRVRALDGISFTVRRGEFFGFLGPNGAGKTTTIRILTGQIPPDEGTAEILDTAITDPLAVKRAVGIVPEITALPSFLTVYEYLTFVCAVREIETEQIDFWLETVGLTDRCNDLCRDLSKGMKQKLSFAAAFIHDPQLAFLDEPFTDMDPLMQHTMRKFLRSYVKEGGTIFLSTHILEIAEKLCSAVAIIHKGTPLTTDRMTTLTKDRDLEETFLTLVAENE
jgi:ABC-2 type transport system ATP-binding protein